MESALSDKRFAHIGKDPRFRRVPTSTRKVSIDKRFNAMFNDKRFKTKYTVDKRGKPVNLSSSEQLKDFYELESEDGDDEEEDGDEEEEDGNESDEEDNGKDTEEGSTDEDEQIENDRTIMHKKKNDSSKLAKSTSSKPKQTVNGFIVTDLNESKKELEKNEEDTVEISDVIKAKLQDVNVDYARGEAPLFSGSSSSDEESSTDEEEIVHDWGELDKDAEETETATYRLAVCNMDWDRIRAVDLMVLFQSFAPQGGRIKNVIIYPSEFGLERMKEEEITGPRELVEMKPISDDVAEVQEETDELGAQEREKLRQYQLKRLKYYYAVVECDSAETANKIYEECDGQEFESSAARLDLRFIPDDMTFDQEPKDVCDIVPDATQYQPQLFISSALQQAQVHLTWDETDRSRAETMQKLFKETNTKKPKQLDLDDERIKTLLATSSEEDEEDEDPKNSVVTHEADDTESCVGESERIAKYRNLLASINQAEEEEKKKKGEMEMEITWGVGLKSRAEELVKKKLAEKVIETPWEQQLAKRREKRKARKQEKKQLEVASASDDESDDIPSDVDMNDPYFREEFDKEEFRKSRPNKKKIENKPPADDDSEKAAALELLLMDDEEGKKHFNMKSLLKEEKKSSKNSSKKNDKNDSEKCVDDGFKIEVSDPRFSALYTSHHFNLDPSDVNFRKTEAMELILKEKQKRRMENPNAEVVPAPEQSVEKKTKMDSELTSLIRSVKLKTTMQNDQKKFKSARY